MSEQKGFREFIAFHIHESTRTVAFPDFHRRLMWSLTVQVGLRTQIIAERDYTEPLRGSRSGLEDRMKIEIVHCPT
jgi:hypothetical protein